ncbi:MAG TPA: hypothetical protein VG897_14445, partial [Terriglobales bacterium]|nr:hypothetical protein [Terriglobales bacterium]
MHQVLNNKLIFGTILAFFVAACGANLLSGRPMPPAAHSLISPDLVVTAHGPTMPPDPWEGTTATLVAHGPTMPPDPWEGTSLKHGP